MAVEYGFRCWREPTVLGVLPVRKVEVAQVLDRVVYCCAHGSRHTGLARKSLSREPVLSRTILIAIP
jgi:hypothetical protein